jgi:hypothetical protein
MHLGLLTAAARSKKSAKPPLDFSGVWTLDEKASSGFAPAMKGAVLSVKQTGDRILIEPVGKRRERILAEVIVADGRPYEKAMGTEEKGTVTVAWAKDRKSLWIEVVAGPKENPRASVQRSVWKLSENGKVWLRQSVSMQGGQTFEARLVFRKKAK